VSQLQDDTLMFIRVRAEYGRLLGGPVEGAPSTPFL
jgi:hypothetical protein